MKTAHWAVGAVAGLALNVSVGNAQAASVTADLKSAFGEMSNVEKSHVRYGYGPGIGLYFGGGHHHHHGFHGHGHHHHHH